MKKPAGVRLLRLKAAPEAWQVVQRKSAAGFNFSIGRKSETQTRNKRRACE